jgi:hypothetical protein
LRIAVAPTLKAALEQAARDNARSVPLFIESLLSEHLTAKGYLRTGGEHGIPDKSAECGKRRLTHSHLGRVP